MGLASYNLNVTKRKSQGRRKLLFWYLLGKLMAQNYWQVFRQPISETTYLIDGHPGMSCRTEEIFCWQRSTPKGVFLPVSLAPCFSLGLLCIFCMAHMHAEIPSPFPCRDRREKGCHSHHNIKLINTLFLHCDNSYCKLLLAPMHGKPDFQGFVTTDHRHTIEEQMHITPSPPPAQPVATVIV